MLGLFAFFENGAFYNITGIWGGPYLREVYGYNPVKASNTLLSLSIGFCFGSLLNPYLPDLCCGSKKVTLIVGTLITILRCVPLGFFHQKLKYGVVIALLTIYSVFTAGFGTVTFPFAIEFFSPSIGASVSGCMKFFAFLSQIIYMPLTGKILNSFGTRFDDPEMHIIDGFKYGLWVFNMSWLVVGLLLILFVKNPKNLKGEFCF